jgi:hypothetical protein
MTSVLLICIGQAEIGIFGKTSSQLKFRGRLARDVVDHAAQATFCKVTDRALRLTLRLFQIASKIAAKLSMLGFPFGDSMRCRLLLGARRHHLLEIERRAIVLDSFSEPSSRREAPWYARCPLAAAAWAFKPSIQPEVCTLQPGSSREQATYALLLLGSGSFLQCFEIDANVHVSSPARKVRHAGISCR